MSFRYSFRSTLLVVAPRPTRWIASVLAVQFGSDVLQVAYKRLEETL